MELHLHRLVLIVVAALACAAVEALVAVKEVRSLIPCIAECVDVECMCVFVLLDDDCALCRSGITDLCIADAIVLHICAELLLILVAYLDNHTRVLSEEHLDDVVTCEVVEVDVHTALTVGEAHLEKSGDKATSRDVVTCHNPSLLNHLLNSVEAVCEVFRILHSRNVVANEAEALCEGATAEALLVE